MVSMFCCIFGAEVYLAFTVIAMVLGWTNLMYYTRGFQSLGVYSGMIQKASTNVQNSSTRYGSFYFYFFYLGGGFVFCNCHHKCGN